MSERDFDPDDYDRLRAAAYRDYEPIQPRGTVDWRKVLGRIWAPIALLVGLGIKFGAFAIKFFGIFISVGAYALIWGWKFAIGFVLLILVHEAGHYAEARRQGLHPSLPRFIPFVGAYVSFRQASDPWRGMWIALAGPLVGGLGAAACWIAGEAYDSRFLSALGYTGFFLNLFNLIPVRPFDGGAIVESARVLSHARTYNNRSSRPRVIAIWAMYLGLAAALALAMWGSFVAQDRL